MLNIAGSNDGGAANVKGEGIAGRSSKHSGDLKDLHSRCCVIKETAEPLQNSC